jgi:hypothetical protein
MKRWQKTRAMAMWLWQGVYSQRLFIGYSVLHFAVFILLSRLWPSYPYFIPDAVVLYFLIVALRVAHTFFRGDRALIAMITLAAVFLMGNLMLRPHENVYVYDVQKQKPTILYFSNHFGYQPMTPETECNQAPLYYFLSGALHRALVLLKAPGQKYIDWRGVVSLNYFFYMLFLIYALQCFRYGIRSRGLVLLASAVLLAWPSNILHTYRLGNDILLYLAFTASVYHYTRWYREDAASEMHKSLLWMAVGFATKTSMLMLPMAMLFLTARKIGWRPAAWRALVVVLGGRRFFTSAAMLLLLLAVAAGLGRNAYYAFTLGNTTILEAKPDAPAEIKITPALLGFDVWNYIKNPYSYADGDTYYWNFFLRSLSFGEYIWSGVAQAIGVNVFMALMWAYLLANMGWRVGCKIPFGWAGYWGILIACMIASSAAIRMYFAEFIPWADGRHIFPAVVFFLLAYMHLLETSPPVAAGRQRWNYRVGIAILLGFLVFSMAHDLIQTIDYTRGPRIRW